MHLFVFLYDIGGAVGPKMIIFFPLIEPLVGPAKEEEERVYIVGFLVILTKLHMTRSFF